MAGVSGSVSFRFFCRIEANEWMNEWGRRDVFCGFHFIFVVALCSLLLSLFNLRGPQTVSFLEEGRLSRKTSLITHLTRLLEMRLVLLRRIIAISFASLNRQSFCAVSS